MENRSTASDLWRRTTPNTHVFAQTGCFYYGETNVCLIKALVLLPLFGDITEGYLDSRPVLQWNKQPIKQRGWGSPDSTLPSLHFQQAFIENVNIYLFPTSWSQPHEFGQFYDRLLNITYLSAPRKLAQWVWASCEGGGRDGGRGAVDLGLICTHPCLHELHFHLITLPWHQQPESICRIYIFQPLKNLLLQK